jgi:hypothetical protein
VRVAARVRYLRLQEVMGALSPQHSRERPRGRVEHRLTVGILQITLLVTRIGLVDAADDARRGGRRTEIRR